MINNYREENPEFEDAEHRESFFESDQPQPSLGLGLGHPDLQRRAPQPSTLRQHGERQANPPQEPREPQQRQSYDLREFQRIRQEEIDSRRPVETTRQGNALNAAHYPQRVRSQEQLNPATLQHLQSGNSFAAPEPDADADADHTDDEDFGEFLDEDFNFKDIENEIDETARNMDDGPENVNAPENEAATGQHAPIGQRYIEDSQSPKSQQQSPPLVGGQPPRRPRGEVQPRSSQQQSFQLAENQRPRSRLRERSIEDLQPQRPEDRPPVAPLRPETSPLTHRAPGNDLERWLRQQAPYGQIYSPERCNIRRDFNDGINGGLVKAAEEQSEARTGKRQPSAKADDIEKRAAYASRQRREVLGRREAAERRAARERREAGEEHRVNPDANLGELVRDPTPPTRPRTSARPLQRPARDTEAWRENSLKRDRKKRDEMRRKQKITLRTRGTRRSENEAIDGRGKERNDLIYERNFDPDYYDVDFGEYHGRLERQDWEFFTERALQLDFEELEARRRGWISEEAMNTPTQAERLLKAKEDQKRAAAQEARDKAAAQEARDRAMAIADENSDENEDEYEHEDGYENNYQDEDIYGDNGIQYDYVPDSEEERPRQGEDDGEVNENEDEERTRMDRRMAFEMERRAETRGLGHRDEQEEEDRESQDGREG